MANLPMALLPMYCLPCGGDTLAMFFYDQLESHVKGLGLSMYQLHFMAQIDTKNIHEWKTDVRFPSDGDIRKIAAVERLGLDYKQLKAWYLISKYGKDVILMANDYLDLVDSP